MKHFRIITIAALAVLVLSTGCYKEGGLFGIRGTGQTMEEERYVNSFDKIDMGISADVYLSQDQDEEIIIEAQGNILDNIETYVKGNTLKIRFKRNVLKHDGIKIFISNSVFEGLEISGSGSMVNETALVSMDLDLKISGSGYMELEDVKVDNNLELKVSGSGHMALDEIEVDNNLDQLISGSGKIEITDLDIENDIESKVTGSGKLILEGSTTADFMHVSITGSGKLISTELPVDAIHVNISGSGDCKVWAVSELEATITGSGSVFYLGNPTINTNVTGTGSVLKLN